MEYLIGIYIWGAVVSWFAFRALDSDETLGNFMGGLLWFITVPAVLLARKIAD